jgi:lipoate-protein ligase A
MTASMLKVLPYTQGNRYWNMAVDEALWRRAEGTSECWLRLYGWSEQSVISVGYFQSTAPLQRGGPWYGWPYVRRPTGGGAVFHGEELTYSLAVPTSLKADPFHFAKEFLGALARALRVSGLPVALESTKGVVGTEEPFWCAQRPAPVSLVLDGRRLGGAAQRRSARAILTHGTLPVPGLSRGQAAELVVLAAAQSLGLEPLAVPLSEPVEQLARHLERHKYSTPQWNDRR